MSEPYKAVPLYPEKGQAITEYGVVRSDSGAVVARGFEFLVLAEIEAMRFNNAAQSWGTMR